jgi:hypothetical protein
VVTDDLSISGPILVYRRIQPQYFDVDASGAPILSDGAFRTKELSVFRSDRVTEQEVLNGYPNDGLVSITVQEIRDAGCIVVTGEPPIGHLLAYRADDLGKRISSASATKMARAAKWVKYPPKP